MEWDGAAVPRKVMQKYVAVLPSPSSVRSFRHSDRGQDATDGWSKSYSIRPTGAVVRLFGRPSVAAGGRRRKASTASLQAAVMQSFAFLAAIGHTCRGRRRRVAGIPEFQIGLADRPTDSPATIDVMRVAQRADCGGVQTRETGQFPVSPPDLLALVPSLMNHYGFVENVILVSEGGRDEPPPETVSVASPISRS